MTVTGAKQYFRSRTGKLALTYLAIIMAMTFIFSGIIFSIASRQFDRPLPGPNGNHLPMFERDDIGELLDQRAAEARTELLLSLVLLNLGMLGFGLWFSTYLAGRTMEPIEQAMREQALFVSDASHELRTPLTALRTLNEVALRRKNKITDKQARDLAAENVAETTKLHSLTTSLLNLVHAERELPQHQPVNLQQAASEAMEHVVLMAQEKSVMVEDSLPNIQVLSNAERLAQVIKILLENAVKYSHANGTVQLQAAIQGNTLTLKVIDNGVGIAAKELPLIFHRFYRADQSRNKEKQDGFGIGLALAKSISDQMGMNLAVTSKPGKGSTFSVTLPLASKQ